MPKDFTDYLHDATKATFEGNVKAIADGWNKTERYIHLILAEDRTDFFPAFLEQYIGTLKGGVSTCHYDNELEFARQKYSKTQNVKTETECFTDKIAKHSNTVSKFVQFIADGKLTLDEIAQLEICLNDEEANLEMMRQMLNFRKQLLEKS